MDKIKRIFTNIPLLIGIFIIIYAALGLVYFQKQAERRDLDLQIIPIRTVLEKPAPNLQELEAELAKAENQLETKWASFPSSEQGIELYDALVDMAQGNNVKVVSVVASKPVEKEDGGISYTLLPFNLNVQGSQSNILAFVSSLSRGPGLLQSSEVKSINISTGTSANTTDNVTRVANLQLYIYVQPD